MMGLAINNELDLENVGISLEKLRLKRVQLPADRHYCLECKGYKKTAVTESFLIDCDRCGATGIEPFDNEWIIRAASEASR